MRFTPLPVGTSRCSESGDCRELGQLLDELDFDVLCRDEPVGPTETPSEVVSSERRFSATIRGEAVECVRHFYAPFGCHITCTHPVATSASQDELTARFDRHLASTRDQYGVEDSASVQGVAMYPRRAHRWTEGADIVELQLDASLCCAPGDRDCGMTEMRTYYARSPWTASR